MAAGCLFPSRPAAHGGGPVWWIARGGAREPGGWYRYGGGDEDGRCIAFLSSCSRPYMLDDCRRSFAALGCRCAHRAFWIDWSQLYHPLFREDTVSLVIGAMVLERSWILTVRPVLHRVAVKGFPRQVSYSYGYSCSYVHGRFGGIGIEGYAVRGRGSGSEPAAAVVSVRAGALRIVADKKLGSARGRGGAFGVELEVGSGLTLLAGYDVGTDEISAGVVCRARTYIVGVGWSDHESLGTTISLGAGRLWQW